MNSIEERKAEAARLEGQVAADHFARNGISRQSISSLLAHYWDIFDQMGEVYLPTPHGKVKAACAKGCSMCCHAIILLTAPEAFILADQIEKTRSKEEFEHITEEVRIADSKTRGRIGAERWGFGPPCPLLDAKSGACSVYGSRPLACRGAFSSSVQACQKAFAERQTNPRSLGSESFIFQNADVLIYAMALGMKAAGRPLYKLELNAALTTIWSTDNALNRWINGDDIFLDARAPGDTAPLV